MSYRNDISEKANTVLNLILLAFVLILMRVWYLAVLQKEYHQKEALKPQRRVVIEPAARGAIVDRFGLPLAFDKTLFSASICYAHLREIPSFSWSKNEQGIPIRVPERSLYITKLSSFLGEKLHLDPEEIEDIIHGKAALFPHTPFLIKEEISEALYFELKMLERKWPGLQVQRRTKRLYPFGKIGCDILGYLGPIGSKEYNSIAALSLELESYLQARERREYPFLPPGFSSPSEVRKKLQELKEKSYSINDLVGKQGVEAFYEETLRGSHGKTILEIDSKGNRIRELPGSFPPKKGGSLTLSISKELQEYAEQLLAAHEGSSHGGALDERWMKGGAIVAMLPQTGEVVALASYPRFDPNDFIVTHNPSQEALRKKNLHKWLESDVYIGELWDGKRNLEKEYFSFASNRYHTSTLPLSWPIFLEAILPKHSQLYATCSQVETLEEALTIQEQGIGSPYLSNLKSIDDQALAFDLCRLAISRNHISSLLGKKIGHKKIEAYFAERQAVLRVKGFLEEEVRKWFHVLDFSDWRKNSFKTVLKKKRKEEREHKQYAKPYTDYLNQAEKTLFKAFWDAYSPMLLFTALTGSSPVLEKDYPHLKPYLSLILQERKEWQLQEPLLKNIESDLLNLSPTLALEYLLTMRGYQDLLEPLSFSYKKLRSHKGVQLEKHLAASFYPLSKYGYGRSQGFRQIAAQGSVFKLVTAYTALMERLSSGERDLNPLVIIDDLKGDKTTSSPSQILGFTLSGNPIIRSYKGGLLPRSSYSNMGKMDLMGALEQSSNLYFALLASDFLKDPLELAHSAKRFGFGEKTGIDLPGEEKGFVPEDLHTNRSGLYSFSIGQHSLVVTPLQTAVMLSTLACQGAVVRPRITKELSSYEEETSSLFSLNSFPLKEELSALGIYFPLFTESLKLSKKKNSIYSTDIIRNLPFPPEVASILFTGMKRVVMGPRGSARPQIMSNVINHPRALLDYTEISPDLLAKTGTAQVLFKQSIDNKSSPSMRTHVWFGGICYPQKLRFSSEKYDHPELVVVVFLRFSRAGREGGTIAGQIIKKWREILSSHQELECSDLVNDF